MSSFTCEHCGTPIIDTPDGYITGCNHYAPELAYSKQYDAYCVIKTGRWTEKNAVTMIVNSARTGQRAITKEHNDAKNI